MRFGDLDLAQVRCSSAHVRSGGPHDGFALSVTWHSGGHVERCDRRPAPDAVAMVLADLARPAPGVRTPCSAATLALLIPRSRLPVAPPQTQHVLAVRMPGDVGVGAVLTGTLRQLLVLPGPMSAAGARTVGEVVLDLLGSVLAEQLGASAEPGRERSEAVVARIHSFIEQRLADPELSLAGIADAHHVSLRSLHKLFERSGTSAATWIRQRRLERCRLDLANPALERLPVHTIARRWGFVNDSHFNRAFRVAFGVAPAAYRRTRCRVTADV